MPCGEFLGRRGRLFRTAFLPLVFATCILAAENFRITPYSMADAKQPRIAVSANGNYHVVFGRQNEIFVTTSTNSGRTFTPPLKVGQLDKLALGLRRGPRIAVAGNSLIVTAISHGDGNLHAWRSADEGASWPEPVLVNSVPTSAREGLHDLASDGGSKAILVWLDLRNGKTELWSSASTNGGASWLTNRRIYRSPEGSICECCHPSAVFHDGEIVVMWRNSLEGNRDMYQASSPDGGKTFSKPTRLGDATWKLNACPMDGGSVASDGKNLCFAWRREGEVYAYAEGYRTPLNVGRGTHPVVTRHRGAFGTVWQEGDKLWWKVNMDARLFLPVTTNASFAASAWDEREQQSVLVFESAGGIYLRNLR